MATITGISAQKKQGRANIYLDGKFFCGMQTITIAQNDIAVGNEISEEELGELQRKSELQVAFDKCIAKLSVRMRSKKEIESFLKEKGFLPCVVDACLQKLEEYGYVNDFAFAEELVRCYPSLGLKRLKQKLLEKGVSSEIVEQALLDKDADRQFESAKNLAQKFVKTRKNDKNLKDKLARHLAYKGYDYDIVQKVLQDFCVGEYDD